MLKLGVVLAANLSPPAAAETLFQLYVRVFAIVAQCNSRYSGYSTEGDEVERQRSSKRSAARQSCLRLFRVSAGCGVMPDRDSQLGTVCDADMTGRVSEWTRQSGTLMQEYDFSAS